MIDIYYENGERLCWRIGTDKPICYNHIGITRITASYEFLKFILDNFHGIIRPAGNLYNEILEYDSFSWYGDDAKTITNAIWTCKSAWKQDDH